LKSRLRAASSDASNSGERPHVRADAPGRLAVGAPIAIVDIGSNSVRLVAYEGLTRAPTPIFNEKALCGLGRGVVTTRKLPQDGVDKALAALRRFRVLCREMGISDVRVLATAAARDADNGPEFLAEAEAAIGAPIELLSGRREAELSALGVVSAIWKPDGVVGDLGGGSLELINVKNARIGKGVTTALGGLTLMDASNKSPRAAAKIVRARPELEGAMVLAADTVVAVGRRILPKCELMEEATQCLRLLSGRAHRVYTGVTLVTPKGAERRRLVETRVRFKRLSSEEIEAYLGAGEWRGKAGGYAIQGLAGAFVVNLVGSYPNVVGLPLYETLGLLNGEGYPTRLLWLNRV